MNDEDIEENINENEIILNRIMFDINEIKSDLNEIKKIIDISRMTELVKKTIEGYQEINHTIQDNFSRLNGLINQTKGVVVMNQCQAEKVQNKTIASIPKQIG